MPSPAAQFLNTFASPTRPQTTSIAGYSLGQTIGYGSTSIIRKAYSASGSISAVKVISLANPSSSLKHHLREAHTWSLLSHEHILPLFAFHHSKSHLYFFTLYCPAGSLLDVLKSLGTPALLQDDAGMIFRQVVRGLSYIHQEAFFVHRDIKLENVLVDEMGFCRIADFGMAIRITDPDSQGPSSSDSCSDDDDDDDNNIRPGHTTPRYHRNSTSTHSLLSLQQHNHQNHFQPGSLPYAAPELLVPRPIVLHPHHSSHPRPHPSQDIWALGVLLYALLSGTLPFFDTFEPRLQLKILNGSYTPPQDIGLGAERILRGCLDKNVLSRWTIAMVDEVAWGVGWGREGDGAGAGEIDDEPRGRDPPQINSAAFVHRDLHHHTGHQIEKKSSKRRARSKSLNDSLPRSLSPSAASLSPSPSYRFPPSPSSSSCSPSPSRSPLSPAPLPSIEIDVVSSPKSLVSDFVSTTTDDLIERGRGRQMRSNTKQEVVVFGSESVPRPLCQCTCSQHLQEEEHEDESLYGSKRLT